MSCEKKQNQISPNQKTLSIIYYLSYDSPENFYYEGYEADKMMLSRPDWSLNNLTFSLTHE